MDPDGGGAETGRWRVRANTRRRGVAEWEGVLAATHVAFDVRLPAHGRDGFAGTVERRRVGALSLVECACTPFAGHRSTGAMGDAGEGLIGLQVVLRGAERVVRSRTRDQVLSAGSVGLWDGSRAVGVEVVEPFTKRTLIFPRELVHAVSPRLADVEALPPLGDQPGIGLLLRYVDALTTELPGWTHAPGPLPRTWSLSCRWRR